MKRVKAACLMQTVHFMLKDGYPSYYAKREVREEYEKYLKQLERSKTKFKVVEEKENEDGSIIIKILKQYNNYEVGEYID
ncbi:MAG: hypothetical protein IJN37_05340 [Clostridia bacterium]|nr:hypothetical protein [Clostridia bacterium]